LRYISAVVLAVRAFGSLGQIIFAQKTTTQSPPQYSPGVITNYDAALPNLSDVLRFRRGERYNITNSDLPELGENSPTALWDLPEAQFQKKAMPFEASDAVVFGLVTNGANIFVE